MGTALLARHGRSCPAQRMPGAMHVRRSHVSIGMEITCRNGAAGRGLGHRTTTQDYRSTSWQRVVMTDKRDLKDERQLIYLWPTAQQTPERSQELMCGTWLNICSWLTPSLPTSASPTNRTNSGSFSLISLLSARINGSLFYQSQRESSSIKMSRLILVPTLQDCCTERKQPVSNGDSQLEDLRYGEGLALRASCRGSILNS